MPLIVGYASGGMVVYTTQEDERAARRQLVARDFVLEGVLTAERPDVEAAVAQHAAPHRRMR